MPAAMAGQTAIRGTPHPPAPARPRHAPLGRSPATSPRPKKPRSDCADSSAPPVGSSSKQFSLNPQSAPARHPPRAEATSPLLRPDTALSPPSARKSAALQSLHLRAPPPPTSPDNSTSKSRSRPPRSPPQLHTGQPAAPPTAYIHHSPPPTVPAPRSAPATRSVAAPSPH